MAEPDSQSYQQERLKRNAGDCRAAIAATCPRQEQNRVMESQTTFCTSQNTGY